MPISQNYVSENERNLGPLIPEIVALLGGIVSTILLALPLNTLLGSSSLIAPLIEEPCKVVGVILLALYFPNSINSKSRGLILGGLAGLGFAFTENLFYALSYQAEQVILLRSIFPVLMHICASATVAIGLAFISQNKSDLPLIGSAAILERINTKETRTFFIIAMGIHFLYNFSTNFGSLFAVVLIAEYYVFSKLYSYLPENLGEIEITGPQELLSKAINSNKEAKKKVIKHCSKCGQELKEGASFCAHCGTEIKTPLLMHCMSCGSQLEEDSIFCQNCGNKIDK